MELQPAVNKILRDLKMAGLVEPVYEGEIRVYLRYLYVAGWEQGRKELLAHNKKKVGQYTKQGSLVNTFDSLREASRKTGFKETGLYSAILRGSITKQGWVWKYL